MNARYNKIINGDTNNGDGLRISLWFSGCEFHCDECHNKQLWDRKNGNEFDYSTANDLLEMLSDSHVDGLSILGGEPLTTYNRNALYVYLPEIYEFLHKRGKNVWLWTGYTIDELKQDEILKDFLCEYVDVIIVGRYVKELHTDNSKYFGSSNQKLYHKHELKEVLNG